MSDLMREAPIGQLLRFVTRNKVLLYPEEKPGFELPAEYLTALNESSEKPRLPRHSSTSSDVAIEKVNTKTSRPASDHHSISSHGQRELALSRKKSRGDTENYTEDRFEVEQELALERTRTLAIAPTKTADGNILVDWYTTDDPANPQNWSNPKRALAAGLLCLYTFAGMSEQNIILMDAS